MSASRPLTGPRDRRGARHPFAGVLAVVFLGRPSRRSDFASIARWAERHRAALEPAFGLARAYAPHETTYRPAAARFSVEQFRDALTLRLARAMAAGPAAAAADGRTSEQADDTAGDPVHVLNAFAHGADVCLAGRPVGGGKGTEPDVLEAHPDELLASRPPLRVLAGDATFCQRPRPAIVAAGRDYAPAIGYDQPDLHETARAAFADATADAADATALEESAGRSRRGGPGTTRRRPSTRGGGLTFPGPRAAVRVGRQTRPRGGAVTFRTRSFATSLGPASVSAVGPSRLTRGHWRVRNNLHYEKDRWGDEDRHTGRRPGLARRFTALLSAAVSVLQVLRPGVPDEPLKARADAPNWEIGRAVKLLTG